MSRDHRQPAGSSRPGPKPDDAAKVIDLAQSIYNLPDHCREDIKAYVEMRVLLDHVINETRHSGKDS